MKKIVVGIVLISIVFLLSACSDNVVKDIEDDVSSNGLAKIIINTEEISISDNTVAQV